MKILVPVVTIEGNIGAGKTTLLQMFEQSLSSQDTGKQSKYNDEPVKGFQCFYGNDPINPLEHFYKKPTDAMPLSFKIMC